MMGYLGVSFVYLFGFLLLGLYGQQNMCLHVTCLRIKEKAIAFYHQTIENGTIALLHSNICKILVKTMIFL